jgi:hypothetical protein
MNLARRSTMLVLAMSMLGACSSNVPIDGAPCPCPTSGYCCENDVCVQRAMCGPPDGMGGADADGGANSDADGGDGSLTTGVGSALMPFGGLDGTCVAVVGGGLQVAACGDSNEELTFVNSTIRTSTGLCVEVRGGDLTAGVVDVATCTNDLSQLWAFQDGQMRSQNPGSLDCLAVSSNDHSIGSPLDVAPCDGSARQLFWPTGYRLVLASGFLSPSSTSECLGVLNDVEQVGSSLDNDACGATDAQVFVLDTSGHIHLANAPSLCVAADGSHVAAPLDTHLVSCFDGSVIAAPWFFGVTTGAQGGVNVLNSLFGCLTVYDGDPTPATLVYTDGCNGIPAQVWHPTPAP